MDQEGGGKWKDWQQTYNKEGEFAFESITTAEGLKTDIQLSFSTLQWPKLQNKVAD